MTKNQIIEQLYTGKNFLECIGKMEPEQLREDLKQEVILILCELPAEKIHQLHNDKALEFFTVRVILNQIKSKTSPFYKKYRGTIEDSYDDIKHLNVFHLSESDEAQSDSMKDRELKELIEDIAIEEIAKLEHHETLWYAHGLIMLYSKLGNFRAIEEETGIPFGSCYKTIKKVLNGIKEKVNNPSPLFSKDELNFIQNNKTY